MCGTIPSDLYDFQITKGSVQHFSFINRTTVYEGIRGLCRCIRDKIAKTLAGCFRDLKKLKQLTASQIQFPTVMKEGKAVLFHIYFVIALLGPLQQQYLLSNVLQARIILD